jgi:hypothetical protein
VKKPSKEELILMQKYRTIKEISYILNKSESWVNKLRKEYKILYKTIGKPKKIKKGE